MLVGTAVANTVGQFVDVSALGSVESMTIILCGLVGAVGWNMLTWWFGIPSSSSHALVGGLAGAVIIAAGSEYVVWGLGSLGEGHLSGLTLVLLALLLAPIIGFWVGFLVHRFMALLLRGARPGANEYLRQFQWFSSAGLAFSHGANDAQKSMGVITMVLALGGYLQEFVVPVWVIVSCSLTIAVGAMLGGWRIVRTLGFGIYKIGPLHALDAQLTSAGVILGASMIGAPVSTTHVVSSSIMGIGASERSKSVRWAKVREIVSAWLITIPASGMIAAATYYLVWLTVGVGR
jgi:PiT family inorganic phosphate transporter